MRQMEKTIAWLLESGAVSNYYGSTDEINTQLNANAEERAKFAASQAKRHAKALAEAEEARKNDPRYKVRRARRRDICIMCACVPVCLCACVLLSLTQTLPFFTRLFSCLNSFSAATYRISPTSWAGRGKCRTVTMRRARRRHERRRRRAPRSRRGRRESPRKSTPWQGRGIVKRRARSAAMATASNKTRRRTGGWAALQGVTCGSRTCFRRRARPWRSRRAAG